MFFVSLEDDLMRLFSSDRIASVMDKLGFQAVSYTHLDVYKRQPLNRKMVPVLSVILYINIAKDIRGHVSASVSYTHLDVYKRQGFLRS